jgi:hypothetical protein
MAGILWLFGKINKQIRSDELTGNNENVCVCMWRRIQRQKRKGKIKDEQEGDQKSQL